MVGANTRREGRRMEDTADSALLPVGARHPTGHVSHVTVANAALAFSQSTKRYWRLCSDGVSGRRTAGRIRWTTRTHCQICRQSGQLLR